VTDKPATTAELEQLRAQVGDLKTLLTEQHESMPATMQTAAKASLDEVQRSLAGLASSQATMFILLAAASGLSLLAAVSPWWLARNLKAGTGSANDPLRATEGLGGEVHAQFRGLQAGLDRALVEAQGAREAWEQCRTSIAQQREELCARFDRLNRASGPPNNHGGRADTATGSPSLNQPDACLSAAEPPAPRSAPTPDCALPQTQADLPAEWSALRAELAALRESVTERWEIAQRRCEATDGNLARSLGALEQQQRELTDHLAGKHRTLEVLVWPEFFRHGDLSAWRQKIEAGLAKEDATAFDLYLALGRFNNALRNRNELRRIGEALHAVSLEAYRFWKSLDLPSLDPAQQWKAAFNTHLGELGVPLEAVLVLENQNFNLSTMVALDSDSTNRITVKETLSWIVQDISRETPRVLAHARVITC
jgi:hypothetical protein